MSVQIRYKNTSSENSLNKVFFVDEKYRILTLKKYLSLKEYSTISDLIKSKENRWGVCSMVLIFAFMMAFLGIIFLPIYLLDGFDYDYNYEQSNRNIVLEDSTFILVDEKRSEIASADLLPGDWITFTHTGNITEIVHSSTMIRI